jgi:hypothetical protein
MHISLRPDDGERWQPPSDERRSPPDPPCGGGVRCSGLLDSMAKGNGASGGAGVLAGAAPGGFAMEHTDPRTRVWDQGALVKRGQRFEQGACRNRNDEHQPGWARRGDAT